MSDHEVISLTQNVANPLVERMQTVADERGHGNATRGTGIGGLLGAMAGSFGGLLWVLLGAGGGGVLGYYLGRLTDEEGEGQPDGSTSSVS